jgi:hypothetical protein
MARTKQTARKSTVRVVPHVPDEVAPPKRPRDDTELLEAIPAAVPPPPTKRRRLGEHPVLRNKIHWRIHSLAGLVAEHTPAMARHSERMDRLIEKVKHQFLEELEDMSVDE